MMGQHLFGQDCGVMTSKNDLDLRVDLLADSGHLEGGRNLDRHDRDSDHIRSVRGNSVPDLPPYDVIIGLEDVPISEELSGVVDYRDVVSIRCMFSVIYEYITVSFFPGIRCDSGQSDW